MARDRSAAVLNRDSPTPLHHQVRTLLLDAIDSGELSPGQVLPPEREYAARFGVSLAPVRQAILGLVEEDYLYRVRGSGTYVKDGKVEEKIAILSSFTESMRARGLRPDITTVEQSTVDPPAKVAQALRARRVVYICRVAMVDGKPVALLKAYLPASRVPGLEATALGSRSLYHELESRYGVQVLRAKSWIEVERCKAGDAALLGMRQGTPVLSIEGITYDAGDKPIEFSRVLYRADRFRFAIESFRRDDRVLHMIGTGKPKEGRSR